MSYEWITPKTDWTTTTRFEYTDYNRIRNNLLYINDMLNELYPDKAQTLDLGDAKTGYANEYAVSEFNAFEEALVSFTRIGQDVNVGDRNYYRGNNSFIWADALNRLEQCCLKWYNLDPIITSVTISPKTFEVQKDDTISLVLNVIPSDAQYTVVWNSSNNNIATVNSNGVVSAKQRGEVTITAILSQKTKSYTVTATGNVKVYATAISVSPASLDLVYCESASYTVTTVPSDADDKDDYTYVSSDTAITGVMKNIINNKGTTGDTEITISLNNLTAKINVRSIVLPKVFVDGFLVYNNKIHLIGGHSSEDDDYYTHYTWEENFWTKLVNVPVWTFRSSLCVYNNEIHLVGGEDTISGETLTQHYKYNGSTWSRVGNIPFATSLAVLISYNNELHLLGANGTGASTKHYKYNGSTWTQVSTLPIQTIRNHAVVYNGAIHIFSRFSGEKQHYKWDGSSWTSVSTLPIDRISCAIVFDNKIHIFGEYTTVGAHYTWNGSSWTKQNDTIHGFNKAVVFNNKIYGADSNHSSSGYDVNNAQNMFVVES